MPTPVLPPTPTASAEIAAQERPWTSSSSESNLALPPPALQSAAEDGPLSSKNAINTKTPCSFESTNTRPPNRAVSTSNKKSRLAPEDGPFSLPSPPTRSRKIIQMKPPRPQAETQSRTKRRKITSTSTSDPPSTQKSSSSSSFSSSPNHVNTTSKPTKKAIRKTAHSLIERRRRSKMNDAFSTLKDMIPACRTGDERAANGKEMHKLDVLNAGIEYFAYLERCLEKANEKRWEGKIIGGRSIGRDQKEEMNIECVKEDARPMSVERQHESQSEQYYHLPQDKRVEGKKKEEFSLAPAHSCHCRCHSQSRGEEDAGRTTLLPSPPLLQSPFLEPQSQGHPTAQFAYVKDAARDRDRERDREETTSTAAALLMLTSTDRRGGRNTNIGINATTTHSRSPSNHHHYDPSTTTTYHQTETSPRKSQIQTHPPTTKTGLSVRDLLLK